MVLIRNITLLILLVVGSAAAFTPWATAHPEHQKQRAAAAAEATAPAPTDPRVPGVNTASAMDEHMEGMDGMEMQRPTTFLGRLTDWFGRMHPFAVHFPIALFPVALIALIFARRRGETVELIRALIIVAGVGSVIAAALGWLNGGLTINDVDPLLMIHRWLGTVLGLLGGIVAIWAWRRRSSVHTRGMVMTLGLILLLVLAQGFLGASLTHGMEHMMF